MKALKTLVIGMGLLIVIGIALVGYGLSRGAPHEGGIAAERPAPDAAGAPFASEVPVPGSARLEQVTAAGDRLVLRLSGPDELILLDARTGRLAGTVKLVPELH